jgi:hypothetical protein
MISNKIVLLGVITAFMLSLTIGFHYIYAAPITLDIHKAKNPGPGFGPDKIGTVSIDTTYPQQLQQRQNKTKHLRRGSLMRVVLTIN